MDATVREFVKSTYQSLTGSVKGSLRDSWRIDGLGLLSISILVVMAIYIFINSRCETCGFENPPLPAQQPMAKAPQYTGVSDLPEAPQNNLADVNSLPYQDPAMVKSSTEMLRQLKQDMDGFSTFELEKMPDVSDPAVKLPITQFKGDYQRVKDELMVVNRTPGVQPSLSVQKINEMAANLRFLQRTYRTYANNELVPQPQTPMCQVGAIETVEGFFVAKGNGEVCARSTECSSGNCNMTLNPHVCSDPQDPSTITGGSYTSSGVLNSVPQVCYGTAGQVPNTNLGYPSPDNGLRLYTKAECETNLGGVWQDNGVCHESKNLDGSFPPISGSWSVMCRNMNPASGTSSTVASGSSVTASTASTASTTTATPVTDPSALYNSALSWMSGSSSGTTTTVDTVSPSTTTTTTTTGSNGGSNVTTVITDTPAHAGDPNYARITRTQLDLLVQKIAVEITRLQASGTTDPIVRSRVNIFLRIKQSLTDIQKALDAGTMKPQDIPILVKDYNNFLPAIGSTSTGIAGLLSESGYPTLASLFNAFSQGDITNSEINNRLLHSYARALINGLSYKFDISYTSANEVEARKAEAIKAAYDSGDTAADIGMKMKMYTGHPRTMHGSRGAFDSHIRQMDLNGFERDSQGYSRPSASTGSQGTEGSGGFDWKGRAEKIFDNVKRAGMDPYDYGMDPDVYANAINTDFSWRGYTKMVCSRLATNAEQGMAEKMGCPPASWIGWRS